MANKADFERQLDEVAALRRRVAELEARESRFKKADKAARRAYGELDRLFDTLTNGLRVIDKDFNIVRVNDAFTLLSGMSKDECVGRKCYEVLRGCFCNTPGCPLTQVLQGEEHIEVYTEKERRDGTTVPYIVTATPLRGSGGKIIGIVEDFRNITARRQAQKAFEEHLHFLQRLIDSIPNPIYYKDAQAVYRGCNAAFEGCIGLRRSEVVGKSVFDLYPTDLAEQYHEMDLILLRQQGVQVFEAPFVCAYGATKHVIYKKATFSNIDGSLGGLVGMIIDITDRKQAEQERERLVLELQEALAKVKTLSGLLPICSSCKKIRDDKGYWNQIEKYIVDHSEAEFSHGICPQCLADLYPGLRISRNHKQE